MTINSGVQPLKTLFLSGLGALCLVLGVLGLLLPFAPGLPFLLLAAICFAALSRGFKTRLSRHPRLARLFGRMDQGAHLDMMTQARLAFWAVLEAANPKR